MSKILIVNPFGLGDMVFSFWMVEMLRKARPACTIDFLCNERTVDLARFNPGIRKTFVFNRDAFRQLWKSRFFGFVKELGSLLRAIRSERYNVCFDLSMGREYAFFLMCLGIPKRIGFDYKGRGRFLTERIALSGFEDKPVREYYADLARRWLGSDVPDGGYPSLPPNQERDHAAREWMVAQGLKQDSDYIVIAPGGGKSWGAQAKYKQWNPDNFATVASAIARKFNGGVVFLGSQEERELCDQVRRSANVKNSAVMTGESLSLVLPLLKQSRFFLGNDGGLSHLADLLEIPQIVLFRPVNEAVYGPRRNLSTVILTENVSCRPCYSGFKFPPCQHDRQCLENLSAEKVMQSMETMMTGPVGAR